MPADEQPLSKYFSPLILFLLFLSVFVVYLPSLSGEFLWDDFIVLQNQRIVLGKNPLAFWTGSEADYWPVTYSVFWLLYRLFEDAPLAYHIINLLLHTGNALLLGLLLRQLRMPGGRTAMFLFALHPLQVESVAYIFQLKSLLAVTFFFLALHAYFKNEERKNVNWYAGALVFFILSLLTKTSTAMLPATLLLYHFFRDGTLSRQTIARTLPFFLVTLVLVSVTLWFNYINYVDITVWETDFLTRILTANRNAWFYLLKFLWPWPVMAVYPRVVYAPDDPVSYLPLVASILACWLLFRHREKFSGALFFGVGFFALNIFPALGLVSVYYMKFSLVADHWIYPAIGGLCAVSGMGLQRLGRILNAGGFLSTRIGERAETPALLLLGLLTLQQTAVYQSQELFWKTAAEKNPNAALAHNNLGVVYFDKKMYRESLDLYRKALELDPRYAEARYNLGYLYARIGETEKAIQEYGVVLRLNPKNYRTHNALALIYMDRGALENAKRHFLEALKYKADFHEAYNNLGLLYSRTGDFDPALQAFHRALQLNPQEAGVYVNIGSLHMQRKEDDRAEGFFRKALEIRPTETFAYFNLGVLYARQANGLAVAIDFMRRGLQLQSEHAAARILLGDYLERQGDLENALIEYRRAAGVDPQNKGLGVKIRKIEKRVKK